MAHRFDRDGAGAADARELLEELGSSAGAVDMARELSSVKVRAAVSVRSADVCQRRQVLADGTTLQVQRRSMSCLLREPVWVGSVFHLSFDRDALDLLPQLAVCDRCTMLGDTAFEVRFQLVDGVDLPADPQAAREG